MANQSTMIPRNRFIRFLLPGLPVAAVLVLAELGFRFLAWYAPETQNFPTAMQDSWLGRYCRMNSLRFRDAEPAWPPVDTRPLLAVVGDSFAFGWGIEDVQERYGEQLAAMLGWRSVNAALPYTHTLNHIEFLDKILPLKPDFVILLYVFNDIEYLSPVAPRTEIPARLLFEHSHLYQQVAVRCRNLLSGPTPPLPHYNPDVLNRHVADLKRFAGKAASGGAGVAIVPFTRMGGDNQHNVLLADAARNAGIAVWLIDDAFRDLDTRELWCSRLDPHPGEQAHLIAARGTVPHIQQAIH